MAEAHAMVGKLDTPITAGIIVVGAVAVLIALHRVVIKIK